MYTNGQPQGVVADFIKFVLSPAGQKLVSKEGFIPVTIEAKEKQSRKSKK